MSRSQGILLCTLIMALAVSCTGDGDGGGSGPGETISAPETPSGPGSTEVGVLEGYSTGGAASSVGHSLEYRFDWGDGNYSGWSSSTSASHAWASEGVYSVKAQARCAAHTDRSSSWSGTKTVSVTKESEAYVFHGQWGEYGTGDGQFTTQVGSITWDGGKVYVAQGDRVQVFTDQGTFISSIQTPRRWGYGIAVDYYGNIYVGEVRTTKYTLVVYSAGVELRSWEIPNCIKGIEVNSSSDPSIYVSSTDDVTHEKLIQVFNRYGSLQDSWEPDDLLTEQVGIALDYNHNWLFLLTFNWGRVYRYRASGTYELYWGNEQSSGESGMGKFDHPYGIDCDIYGVVYVADSGNDRVHVFTASGSHIATFGGGGSGDGQFDFPTGIASTAGGAEVFVFDSGNSRIQVFKRQ